MLSRLELGLDWPEAHCAKLTLGWTMSHAQLILELVRLRSRAHLILGRTWIYHQVNTIKARTGSSYISKLVI